LITDVQFPSVLNWLFLPFSQVISMGICSQRPSRSPVLTKPFKISTKFSHPLAFRAGHVPNFPIRFVVEAPFQPLTTRSYVELKWRASKWQGMCSERCVWSWLRSSCVLIVHPILLFTFQYGFQYGLSFYSFLLFFHRFCSYQSAI
jgi:hypothetical protein